MKSKMIDKLQSYLYDTNKDDIDRRWAEIKLLTLEGPTCKEFIDLLKVAKAHNLAAFYHKNQLYCNEPYMVHLNDVHQIASKYKLSESILIASYLHDILEDTECTFEELWNEFGWEVAVLVFLVTDESGSNRKERKEKTYPKISTNSKAILLKLCDRIANVCSSKKNNQKLFLMYQKEHQEFLEGLGISGTRYGLLGEMLSELNDLLYD